jgi:hypothetical protein
VTGTLKQLGPAKQIGKTVTEQVSAPDPSLPVPAVGATAAAPITFTVPKGTDRINVNMVRPDPTNSNTLDYILTDPQGKLTQISYDFGTAPTRAGAAGTVPNIQHTEVTDPTPGKWTATILWGNGRAHLQNPANVPGTYTGPMSFEVTGRNYVTSKLGGGTVKIPAESTAPLTVEVPLASAPGDDDMSVQLSANNGATESVPVLARTLIPSTGGPFAVTTGTSVGRSSPPLSQFFVNVPAGHQSISVSFNTADANADNAFTYELLADRSGGGRRRHADDDALGHRVDDPDRKGQPVGGQPGRRPMGDRHRLGPGDLRPPVQPDDQRQRGIRQLRGDGAVRVADRHDDDRYPGYAAVGAVAGDQHNRGGADVLVHLHRG